MDPTNSREQADAGERVRIPPPPPRTPPGRTLHLVPAPATGTAGPTAAPAPAVPLQREEPAAPLPLNAEPLQAPPAAAPAGSAALGGVSATNLRRLERELAEVQDEVGALQEMLEELPTILERKFRGRLDKLLEQQRLLLADNQGLRRKLQALCPGVDLETQALRPRALLPPSLRTALKLDGSGNGESPAGRRSDSDRP